MNSAIPSVNSDSPFELRGQRLPADCIVPVEPDAWRRACPVRRRLVGVIPVDDEQSFNRRIPTFDPMEVLRSRFWPNEAGNEIGNVLGQGRLHKADRAAGIGATRTSLMFHSYSIRSSQVKAGVFVLTRLRQFSNSFRNSATQSREYEQSRPRGSILIFRGVQRRPAWGAFGW